MKARFRHKIKSHLRQLAKGSRRRDAVEAKYMKGGNYRSLAGDITRSHKKTSDSMRRAVTL